MPYISEAPDVGWEWGTVRKEESHANKFWVGDEKHHIRKHACERWTEGYIQIAGASTAKLWELKHLPPASFVNCPPPLSSWSNKLPFGHARHIVKWRRNDICPLCSRRGAGQYCLRQLPWRPSIRSGRSFWYIITRPRSYLPSLLSSLAPLSGAKCDN